MDRRPAVTGLLAVLTVIVQVATIWVVADPMQAVDAPAPVQTAENSATTAVPVLMLLVGELIVVWLLWALYKRLPTWLRRWVKRGLIGAAMVYAALYALVIMPALFGVYAAVIAAWMLGYRWLAYDIGGITLGVIVAATLGGYLGPVPLIVLLVGLIVYDYVAVIETRAMDELVKLMAAIGLPAMVVIPKRLDFDLGGYLDALAADGSGIADGWRDRVHVTIGVGDFAIPAALTAAAFRFHGPTVAIPVLTGTVIGMILLGRHIGDQALPGLPWLGGGALAGYAIGGAWILLSLP